ncbi:zinc ribbon domain-containing protein [Chloroflexota bacterium]
MTTIMKNAGRILLFLFAFSLLLVNTDQVPVSAQGEDEPAGFENVQLWVYPEFDDPRLLVMMEGQIVGQEAPAEVRFLVPSTAEMYSAGSMDAQGQYTGGPPDRKVSSIPGWDEISYEVTTDTFRVEYYDPAIIGQPDRSISYEFRWLFPISELEVTVQKPLYATNFNVSPAGTDFTDTQGLTSYLYNYSELDDEPPLKFEITYTNADARISLSEAEEEVAAGSPTTAIIIAAGVVILVVVGFFMFRKPKPKTRAERRKLARSGSNPVSENKQTKTRFCSQCGKPVEGQYKFCPHCGEKV